jgi:hypothetical protein
MKYSDLYSIENQYTASGHHYVIGRLHSGDIIRKFILFMGNNQPQTEWSLMEVSKRDRPTPRRVLAGRYYLQMIRNTLSV